MADAALESLLEALLFEGYALYPYTRHAAKNATPTPFGIVYPPAYAHGSPAAFDSCGCTASSRAAPMRAIEAEVRLLQAAPEGGHRAVERRLRGAGGRSPSLPPRRVSRPSTSTASPAGCGSRPRPLAADVLAGRAVRPQHDGGRRRDSTVPRPCSAACSRPTRSCARTAAASSRRSSAGRSGMRSRCESVNTYPVLATRGRRRAGRSHDRAARPPPARAREPGQPVRRHRDRGGAAAARDGALATASASRSPPATRPCARWSSARPRRRRRISCGCTAARCSPTRPGARPG